MDRIASFSVDHRKIKPGIYVSRTDRDVVTYDVRMRCPNLGDYISNQSLHTFEHLFATYARNSRFANSIVYIGPMGCRTGFYLLTFNDMSGDEVCDLVRESMEFLMGFEGEIPGAALEECGNYKEHSLEAAKADAARFRKDIDQWRGEDMVYPK